MGGTPADWQLSRSITVFANFESTVFMLCGSDSGAQHQCDRNYMMERATVSLKTQTGRLSLLSLNMCCSLVVKQGTTPPIKDFTQNTRFFFSFVDGCCFISSVKKKKKEEGGRNLP